ncbi:hypothetical protein [Azotobacter beijerinckii]|uniref:hypothetical protein n=1 Tax=Azotobacter beijerinckii TaxID=170623 RepID=UPI002955737F|nr:hypothetical protein [Azotobacter beijerinckii]MDV7209881.1 hypothetical protein [Azotobacter beijerinckii]
MPLIQRLVGVRTNDASLPILQRDAIIDDRTVGLIDAASKYAYSGEAGAVPVNSIIRDLVRGGSDSVVQNPLAYDGKSFAFDANLDRIDLGANWKVPSVTHFAVGIWLNTELTGYTTGAITASGIATYRTSGTPAGYQWSIYQNTNADGTMRNISFVGNSCQPVAITYTGGSLVQMVFEYISSGGLHYAKAYLNGVLVATGATEATEFILPLVSDVPKIGRNSAGFQDTLRGEVHRLWLQKLDTEGRSLNDIIALDYARNLPRFAA